MSLVIIYSWLYIYIYDIYIYIYIYIMIKLCRALSAYRLADRRSRQGVAPGDNLGVPPQHAVRLALSGAAARPASSHLSPSHLFMCFWVICYIVIADFLKTIITCVCAKKTPPEKKTCGKIRPQSSKPGAGEQFSTAAFQGRGWHKRSVFYSHRYWENGRFPI